MGRIFEARKHTMFARWDRMAKQFARIGKEITIKGASGVTSNGYRSAIETIESGRIDLEAMHTHDFALDEAELAIRTLAREVPGDESIHSCLLPEH